MKAVCNSKNIEAVKYSVEGQASLADERYLLQYSGKIPGRRYWKFPTLRNVLELFISEQREQPNFKSRNKFEITKPVCSCLPNLEH